MEQRNFFYRVYNKLYLRPKKKRKKAQKCHIADFSIEALKKAIIGNPASYTAYRVYLDKLSRSEPDLYQKIHDVKNRVEMFCVFIGHPRSGHSLVGSLVDAHPDAVIAQELNSFQAFAEGINKNEICDFISANSQIFGSNGRLWGIYDYIVPNQHQGEYRNLKIVGDKKGDGVVDEVKKDLHLLPAFLKSFDYKVKFFNVIRNPFDNITSISKNNKISLTSAMELFFERAEFIDWIRRYVREKGGRENILDLKSEALVREPVFEIKRMCNFLGLEAFDDYIEDCASIVFKKPNTPRKEVSWDSYLVDVVYCRMKKYSFLEGYFFDEGCDG